MEDLTLLHRHKPNPNSDHSQKKRKSEFDVEDEKNAAEIEEVGEEKSEITTKTEREISSNTCSRGSSVAHSDYIHVRARRGQATDSHSLAERARREKISKKMKCLQDLVPGCNKVTGKAGMLDEIINYVQSLQKQVEFLSMKLAAINPSIDDVFAKEIQAFASLPAASHFEATNSISFAYNSMQNGSIFGTDITFDPQKAGASCMPVPEAFPDLSCISVYLSTLLYIPFCKSIVSSRERIFCCKLQQMTGWESDNWQSLFNSGFH